MKETTAKKVEFSQIEGKKRKNVYYSKFYLFNLKICISNISYVTGKYQC